MASDPPESSRHEGANIPVTIRMFGTHEAAAIAAGNLRAHGIECWVNADDCGGMYSSLALAGGVRLLVRSSDADAAVALLDSQPAESSGHRSSEAPTESSDVRVPIFVFTFLVVIIGLVVVFHRNNKFETSYHYSNREADRKWVYRSGHLIEFLQDRNLDGVWDHWVHYSGGQATRSEYDNNFDGKPDLFWTYSNDEAVSMQKDTDFNGTPDEFGTYNDGVPRQVDVRPNGAKLPTQRWIYKNGVLTEIRKGAYNDGRIRFRETVRYDPYSNPISTNFGRFPLLSAHSQ